MKKYEESSILDEIVGKAKEQQEQQTGGQSLNIRTPMLDKSMGNQKMYLREDKAVAAGAAKEYTPRAKTPDTDAGALPWENAGGRPDYRIQKSALDTTVNSPQRVWPVVHRPLDLDARKGDTQKRLDELKAKRTALEEQAKAEQEAKRQKTVAEEAAAKQSYNQGVGQYESEGKPGNWNSAAEQPYNMGVGAYQKKEETYVPGGDSKPDNTGVYPRHSYQGATATTELSDIDKELKELDRQIREKEDHMQMLERTEKLQQRGKRKAELEQVAEKEDFAKKSRYVSTALEGFWEKATSQYSMGYEDLTYEYINNTPGVRDKVKGLNVASGVLNFPDIIGSTYEEFADNEHDISSKGYEYMKPKEVAVYNYLYRRKGRETAEEYLDLLQEELNERKGGKIADDLEEKTLLQYGYMAYNAVDRFGRNMKNAVNVTDDYIPYAVGDFAQRDIREDMYNIGPDLPDWMGGMSLGQLGADIIDTTFYMLPSIALNMAAPGAGTASMGVSAAGNAYQSMLNEGYTKEQARAYGTLVGLSEVCLEKLLNGVPQMGKSFASEKVLGNLAKLDNVFGRVARSKGGQIIGSMISEGSEEGLQEVIEPMIKSAITGEAAEIEWENVLYSTFLGGMSGGMFQGVDILTNPAEKAGKGAEEGKAALPGEPNTDAAKSERPGMELLEGFDIPQSEAMPKTEAQQRLDAVHREMMGMEDVQPQQEAAAPAQTNAVSNPIESYPPQKQKSIRSYIQAVDEKIKSFVQQVKGGNRTFKRQKISDVSDRAAVDIKNILGIDATGYTHNINTNGVEHILLRHGENGKADHSMALDDDIARVGWVLENYDYVELLTENGKQVFSSEFMDSNNNPAPQIRFVKKIDGTYYAVEAACENNYKKLWVQSAYLQKNGDVTQAPAESQPANHETNARSALASPSPTDTVTETSAEVKEDFGGKGKDESVGAFGGNTVGSAESGFRHEVRKSKVYSNTYANAVDENVRKSGEMATERNPRIGEYDLITEKESLHNAELRTATAEDVDAEYDYLMGKDGWTGEDNDTAFKVLAKLMESGDSERHTKLALRQREAGTTGGQLTQSFAKYSRTPEKATADAAVSLEGLDKWNVPKRFWKKQGFDAWKKGVQQSILEIGTEISKVADGDVDSMRNIVRQLANFRRTTAWAGCGSKLTRAAERMVGKLDFETAKDIATAQLGMIPNDFRKRSKGEMINTIRIQNMLSALTTTNRNLTGNAVGGLTDAVSDSTVGRFADFLLSKATGKRTIGNDVTHAKAYLKAARDAADMAALCVELDIPMEREAKYSTGKTRNYSPQSGIIGRFFSAYEKYLKYSLEVTDKFFEGGTTGAVSEGLRRLGESANLTEKEIQALGEKAGQRRTFKEGRALAKANSGLKEALNAPTKAAGLDIGAGDLLMPFAEVPAEVAQTGIDYSGAGIIEGFAEMATIIRDVRRGKEIDVLRQRKAASDFGRGVTGLTLVSAFTALAAVGILGIHNDKDKDERALDQSLGLSGAQLNLSAAIRFFKGEGTEWRDDDLLLSVDFLEPMNSQMYIGYLTAQEDSIRDMILNYPKNAGLGIVQSVLDMPMSQTLSDLANVVNSFTEVSEDGSFEPVQDAAGQLLGNIGTGFVPSWVRQTAQYIDPYYRDTSGDNAMEKAKNQVMAAIPFASTHLPKKYDGLGYEQRRYDDPVSGFFNTFVNPGKLTRMQTDEIAAYLDDLSDSTENVSIYPEYMAPKSFKVDGEEIMVSGKEMTETYQKTYGDTIADLYGALMENDNFSDLPEDMQVKALLAAKGYATESAKASVSDYKESWSGEPDDVAGQIIRDQMGNRFDGAFGDLTECWKNGKEDSASVEALEEAYQVYKGLDKDTRAAVMEASGGRLEAYFTARQNGIDTKTFAEYYGKYYEIDNADLKASEKAAKWSYELQKAVENDKLDQDEEKALRESLKFYNMFPADTAKFDQLTDAGIDSEDAWKIGELLDGLEPEKGRTNVRDVQKAEAIVGMDLSRKDTKTALKAYLNDSQDENLDQMLKLGFSAEDYVVAWRLYQDYTSGKGKKQRTIEKYMKEFGVSKATAKAIYEIYG